MPVLNTAPIPQRTTFSNAAYTVVSTDRIVAQIGTLSASRTVTLPAANAVNAGQEIVILDASGTITATNTIVIARAGSDTINGAATSITLNAPYAIARLISDGVSAWTLMAAWNPRGIGGTDAVQIGAYGANVATARGLEATAIGSGAQAGNTGVNYCTALGSGANASGSSSTAIGRGAASAGSAAAAFGAAASASAASTVAFGYAASASGTSATAIGNSAAAPNSGGTVIGKDAAAPAASTDATVIGRGATVTGAGAGENVVIGALATANNWRGTAVGYKATANNISSTAIGRGAYASGTHAIAVGRGSRSTANNTIAIGFSGGDSATDVYFESGISHKYTDPIDGGVITRTPSLIPIVIHGFDALDETGSPTNDVAGGPLRLAAGRGTGTGASGTVDIQTAPSAGSSNNTKNALVTAAQFDASTTADDIRMLLWDVTAASLKRVSRGASDSGGSGYRLLRIPN